VLLHPRGDPRGGQAPHGPLPEGAYPGTCRSLSAADRAAREAAGRPPALRVRASGAVVEVEDELAGRVTGVVDDLVVRRNDGSWAYNLAVVVDDHEQGVGQVVRGADLLDTTPRQAWLHGRLGYGPSPATRTCRSSSARTAPAWPSATARSRWPTGAPRARTRRPSAACSPRPSGSASPGRRRARTSSWRASIPPGCRGRRRCLPEVGRSGAPGV
jgi:glutamyl-tRNA synthetase